VEARRDGAVTNQVQQQVRLTEVSRFVAARLDGTRDHHELSTLVCDELQSNLLSRELLDVADDAADLVEEVLERLRREALLVA
jgi:hypothetical protein